MSWIADRARAFDSSGIRKVFEMAATMKNPINLSIGQPDFDVPPPIKDACVDAIQGGKNAYSVTQGIAPLRERLTPFIANPDLVERFKHNLPLSEANRDTYYAGNENGYTDYPFAVLPN
jgi:aspartate/methionine/tyrosine aminotransferase